ncbi:MAG: hypothetical protein AB3N13_16825 [Arenibacterium sp.]
MTLSQWAIFGLGSLIFAAWAFFMFLTLFRLRKRGADQTGQTFPGPLATLRQWHHWLTSPEDRRDRRLLGGLTLALVTWVGVNAYRVTE